MTSYDVTPSRSAMEIFCGIAGSSAFAPRVPRKTQASMTRLGIPMTQTQFFFLTWLLSFFLQSWIFLDWFNQNWVFLSISIKIYQNSHHHHVFASPVWNFFQIKWWYAMSMPCDAMRHFIPDPSLSLSWSWWCSSFCAPAFLNASNRGETAPLSDT